MIDFNNDDDLQVLGEISEYEGLPDFVKKADAELMSAASELPKEAFAIPSTRLYPMYDQASTWLSSRYFVKSANSIPEPTRSTVENVLKEACSLFDITWPDTVVDPAPEISKSAYALSEEHGGNEVLRYPVDTKDNTELSVVKFAEEYKSFPPLWRRSAALAIKKKAAEQGVVVGDNHPVLKYAAEDKCVDTITDALNVRASHADEKYASLYKDLIEKAAGEDPGVLVDVIEGLDKAANIAKYWDIKLPDPVLSVYKTAEVKSTLPDVKVEEVVIADGTEKAAAGDMITLADRNISLSQLEEMPLEWYEEILGDDVAAEISEDGTIHPEKLKMILESIARPSQLLIVNNLPF